MKNKKVNDINKKITVGAPQNKKPIKKPTNRKVVKVEDKKVDNKKVVINQLKEKLSIVDLKDKSNLVDTVLIVLIGLQIMGLAYLLLK